MASKVAAIVLAGGSGERFGGVEGKQIATVAGMPVMSWSLRAVDAARVDSIVVVCHPDRVDEYRRIGIEPLRLHAPVVFVAGGATRQESAAAGLAAIPDEFEIVLLHDGARPLVTPETIRSAIDTLTASAEIDGVVVGHPSVDTVKVVDGHRVVETLDRSRIWAVQTPQVFRANALRAAFEAAALDGFCGTDDASVVEHNGGAVMMFEGPRDNIKVTVAEDATFVEAVLRQRAERE